MAIVVEASGNEKTSYTSSPTYDLSAGIGTPTANNLLVACLAVTIDGRNITATPSGWTTLYEHDGDSEAPDWDMTVWVGYKVAGASESDPVVTLNLSSICRWSIIEVSGTDSTSPFEAKDEDTTDVASGGTTIDSGSATAVNADGIAIAATAFEPSDGFASGTNTLSNSFVLQEDGHDDGGFADTMLATLIYTAAGAKTTTFTTTDTGGDANYGSIAVFKAAGGGGGTSRPDKESRSKHFMRLLHH